MNNNRGNNRRRGRGNNNTNARPQNGGQQLNRIDSRARGNAPQLLEKYRKLAQDAHLNGDRVQAEYYLQFADHYFRVLADARVRQEEARKPRDERWQESGDGQRDEADDGNDFTVESDFPTFDTPPVYTRREREERGEVSSVSGGNPGGQQNGNYTGNSNAHTNTNPRRREDPVIREEVVEEAEASVGERIWRTPMSHQKTLSCAKTATRVAFVPGARIAVPAVRIVPSAHLARLRSLMVQISNPPCRPLSRQRRASRLKARLTRLQRPSAVPAKRQPRTLRKR